MSRPCGSCGVERPFGGGPCPHCGFRPPMGSALTEGNKSGRIALTTRVVSTGLLVSEVQGLVMRLNNALKAYSEELKQPGLDGVVEVMAVLELGLLLLKAANSQTNGMFYDEVLDMGDLIERAEGRFVAGEKNDEN